MNVTYTGLSFTPHLAARPPPRIRRSYIPPFNSRQPPEYPYLLRFLNSNIHLTCYLRLYLPSGAAGIVGGVVMLVTYLGYSGIAGICALAILFSVNIHLQKLASNRNDQMNDKLKDRVRAMKQVVDGIKAIKVRTELET